MIIVDSNVWIFAEDDNAAEHAMAARKIQEMLVSETFGINPVIVSEVYHMFSRLLGVEDARRRTGTILNHFAADWLDFSIAVAREAVELAACQQLTINDALIAQQALAVGAPVLTDNVRDFRKVKGLKVIPLR